MEKKEKTLSLANGRKLVNFTFKSTKAELGGAVFFIAIIIAPGMVGGSKREITLKEEILKVSLYQDGKITGRRINQKSVHSQAFWARKEAIMLLIEYIKKERDLPLLFAITGEPYQSQWEEFAEKLYQEEVLPEVCCKIGKAVEEFSNVSSPENQKILKAIGTLLGIEEKIKPFLLKS